MVESCGARMFGIHLLYDEHTQYIVANHKRHYLHLAPAVRLLFSCLIFCLLFFNPNEHIRFNGMNFELN